MHSTSNAAPTPPADLAAGSIRWLWALVVLPVLAAGWYVFRPELLFIDERVQEALPTSAGSTGRQAEPVPLLHGTFHSVAHETQGTASILRLAGGERVLRLADFATSNGPDVRVYLIAADDATDSSSVTAAEHVELGRLKGNLGDQNYRLPEMVDLAKFRAVTIWCYRFHVNFGTAPLRGVN